MTTETAQDVVAFRTMAHGTTFCAHTCHVDGQPCEVLALVAVWLCDKAQSVVTGTTSRPGEQPNSTVIEQVRQRVELPPEELAAKVAAVVGPGLQYLPCERCRYAEQKAAALAGLRLGKRERAILLQAPGTDAKESLVRDGETRAEVEANRRAIGKLGKAGLVETWHKPCEVLAHDPRLMKPWFRDGQWWTYKPEYQTRHTTVRKLAVKLSPLGAVVVDLLRGDLQAGRAVRWGDRPTVALAACRESAADLLARFGQDLQTQIQILTGWCRTLGALGTDGATAEFNRLFERLKCLTHLHQATQEQPQGEE